MGNLCFLQISHASVFEWGALAVGSDVGRSLRGMVEVRVRPDAPWVAGEEPGCWTARPAVRLMVLRFFSRTCTGGSARCWLGSRAGVRRSWGAVVSDMVTGLLVYYQTVSRLSDAK